MKAPSILDFLAFSALEGQHCHCQDSLELVNHARSSVKSHQSFYLLQLQLSVFCILVFGCFTQVRYGHKSMYERHTVQNGICALHILYLWIPIN